MFGTGAVSLWTLLLHLMLCIRAEVFNRSVSTTNTSGYETCRDSGGTVVSHVFCLPPNYRKDVLPPTEDGGPLSVFFKLPISEISEIDDHKSIVTLRLSYKLMWPESRMVVNASADWGEEGEINISPDNIEHIWTPDVIIHDLVRFNKPEILNQVGALEIFRDKRVYYKVRSDITIVCKAMEFALYPLDNHKCYLILTSFGYDSEHMTLSGRWTYRKENQRTLPFNVELRNLPYPKTVFRGSSSNYSVYGFEMQLSRSLGPFILSIYLPSAMFVTMSWVAFFVPPDIVPARIVLLVTLCLVLVNMFNSTTARIPVSNAVTAMEVWLLACMLLVFLSLVEYAVILRRIVLHHRHLERHRRAQEKERERPKNGVRPETLSHTELLLQVEEDETAEHKFQVAVGEGECRRRRKKKQKEKWHSQTTAEVSMMIIYKSILHNLPLFLQAKDMIMNSHGYHRHYNFYNTPYNNTR